MKSWNSKWNSLNHFLKVVLNLLIKIKREKLLILLYNSLKFAWLCHGDAAAKEKSANPFPRGALYQPNL